VKEREREDGGKERGGALSLHTCTSFNTTFNTARSKIKVFPT